MLTKSRGLTMFLLLLEADLLKGFCIVKVGRSAPRKAHFYLRYIYFMLTMFRLLKAS